MSFRRIVTGFDRAGKSIFLSDSAAPRTTDFKHIPGFTTSLLWATRPDAQVSDARKDPAISVTSWVPLPNGTTFMFITFPPDAVMASPGFDPEAAGNEYMDVLPGLAEKFESDHPGMHTSDTVDYGVLIEGEIHLELDDGVMKKLAPRDVVIQNGTRHAWRNCSSQPATMLFVLVGAQRT